MNESPQSRAEQIRHLCNAWLESVKQPGGGIAIGAASERFRLLRNGIQFHELNYEEIRAACIGLTRGLLLRGLNTVVDFDHQFFWAWAGEVLLGPAAHVFRQDEHEIESLFGTCVRAGLAGIRPPTADRKAWEEQNRRHKLTEFNLRELGLHTQEVLAYLGFPLLEAMLKRGASGYVDYAGNVVHAFRVSQADGGIRAYKIGGRCSSLRDLLFLLFNEGADDDLRSAITEVGDHLKSLDSSKDAFDLIYSWRNPSLHGETTYPTIGGTLLNLSILLGIHSIKDQYQQRRDKVWQHVQWDVEMFRSTGHRSPWSYYPPF